MAVPMTHLENLLIESQHEEKSLRSNGYYMHDIQLTVNHRLNPHTKIAKRVVHNSDVFLPFTGGVRDRIGEVLCMHRVQPVSKIYHFLPKN